MVDLRGAGGREWGMRGQLLREAGIDGLGQVLARVGLLTGFSVGGRGPWVAKQDKITSTLTKFTLRNGDVGVIDSNPLLCLLFDPQQNGIPPASHP